MTALFTATVPDDDTCRLDVETDGDGLAITATEDEDEAGIVLDQSEVRQLRDALTSWLGED